MSFFGMWDLVGEVIDWSRQHCCVKPIRPSSPQDMLYYHGTQKILIGKVSVVQAEVSTSRSSVFASSNNDFFDAYGTEMSEKYWYDPQLMQKNMRKRCSPNNQYSSHYNHY